MQAGNEIWPVYVILQQTFFYNKNYMENVTWKLVLGPFYFINPL